jgi:hypothetical protein
MTYHCSNRLTQAERAKVQQAQRTVELLDRFPDDIGAAFNQDPEFKQLITDGVLTNANLLALSGAISSNDMSYEDILRVSNYIADNGMDATEARQFISNLNKGGFKRVQEFETTFAPAISAFFDSVNPQILSDNYRTAQQAVNQGDKGARRLLEMFKDIDTDNSGAIGKFELDAFRERIQDSAPTLDNMFSQPEQVDFDALKQPYVSDAPTPEKDGYQKFIDNLDSQSRAYAEQALTKGRDEDLNNAFKGMENLIAMYKFAGNPGLIDNADPVQLRILEHGFKQLDILIENAADIVQQNAYKRIRNMINKTLRQPIADKLRPAGTQPDVTVSGDVDVTDMLIDTRGHNV